MNLYLDTILVILFNVSPPLFSLGVYVILNRIYYFFCIHYDHYDNYLFIWSFNVSFWLDVHVCFPPWL